MGDSGWSVVTGVAERAGGDYPALTLRSIVGIRRLHWLLFFVLWVTILKIVST